jgi:hypothetical protein
MRTPRKLKKAISKSIIIYDIASCPDGWDMNQVFEVFNRIGVLFYDSHRGSIFSDKPQLANRVGKRVKIVEKK